MRKYRDIITKKSQQLVVNRINERTLYDSTNSTMLISANRSTLGKIISCSSNIRLSLGYTRQTLIDKPVGTIMPTVFRSMHDELMKPKMESSETLIKFSYVNSFALKVTGRILPVRLLVTTFPYLSNGLVFWGMLRPV